MLNLRVVKYFLDLLCTIRYQIVERHRFCAQKMPKTISDHCGATRLPVGDARGSAVRRRQGAFIASLQPNE